MFFSFGETDVTQPALYHSAVEGTNPTGLGQGLRYGFAWLDFFSAHADLTAEHWQAII
jgi:hypothetical protein